METKIQIKLNINAKDANKAFRKLRFKVKILKIKMFICNIFKY